MGSLSWIGFLGIIVPVFVTGFVTLLQKVLRPKSSKPEAAEKLTGIAVQLADAADARLHRCESNLAAMRSYLISMGLDMPLATGDIDNERPMGTDQE